MLQSRAFAGTPRVARSRGVTGGVVVKCVAQPRHASCPAGNVQKSTQSLERPSLQLLAAGALLVPYVVDVAASMAAGGEYGLLEGR